MLKKNKQIETSTLAQAYMTPPKARVQAAPAWPSSGPGVEARPLHYNLETYRRSNQDTCLVHKPALNTGEWVESGDLLADSSASKNGELALGKNILVAYMPWEGYNYEDAILINERLVYDDAYTSVHIERYEIETKESQFVSSDSERITRDIPDLKPDQVAHLDNNGIAKIGSWIEEGDILVGKVTPINPKKQTGYQKFILKLFERKANTVRDSSLRAPKGIKANVISVQILGYSHLLIDDKPLKTKSQVISKDSLKKEKSGAVRSHSLPRFAGTKMQEFVQYSTNQPKRYKVQSKWLLQNNTSGETSFSKPSTEASLTQYSTLGHKPFYLSRNLKTLKNANFEVGKTLAKTQSSELSFSINRRALARREKLKTTSVSYNNAYATKKSLKGLVSNGYKISDKSQSFQKARPLAGSGSKNASPTKNLQSNGIIPTNVHLYLAEKRKIQVGDKMAGRHGNKGIISNILPRQDMPYLPDGTALDIVLNPLGVPSRMNVGQIYECLLGFAGKYLGEHYKIYPFDEMYGAEASRSFVFSKLFEASKKTGIEWLFDPNSPGKIRIFDGRNAECFDQPVTVGIAYMLKLVHMVDDKLHARSTGPYSLVTQQPLRGRAKQGGQRLGEMEVWAIEGYGAAFVLLEMLTLKSDDMTGRLKLWSDLILNKDITLGTPESFKVLVCELQALCLDIGLFRGNREIGRNPELGTASSVLTTQENKQDLSKLGKSMPLGPSLRHKKQIELKEITNLMFLP